MKKKNLDWIEMEGDFGGVASCCIIIWVPTCWFSLFYFLSLVLLLDKYKYNQSIFKIINKHISELNQSIVLIVV